MYDISDTKRLNKVAKILLDYGVRVQKSVFELVIYESTLQTLRSRLLSAIKPEEDGIKILQLCETCIPKRLAIGKSPSRAADNSWEIL